MAQMDGAGVLCSARHACMRLTPVEHAGVGRESLCPPRTWLACTLPALLPGRPPTPRPVNSQSQRFGTSIASLTNARRAQGLELS